MKTLRAWIIISWLLLPAVMGGGGLLLRRLTVGNPDPFALTWIRAFHAHGAVLIILSIVYYLCLDRTSPSSPVKNAASATCFLGIGALAGGFFIHALVGEAGDASVGTMISVLGAIAIASAILVLVYGLLRTPSGGPDPAIGVERAAR